ncbi:hypothetical protein HTZ84_04955 [Haloterrigena sp. SYSU A558-1]|uniref:Uncharacterized protein n=1 Tax=Haloterrigena gelatinilytica TaxID=2741724 RepID=A0ABX2L5Y5_9EURY|nr:hypothetical protein [Haloterrigena gelatinilytica]NUC71665.1 hypothetical protein [Haloterrigena gelatinilytica]
MKIETPVEQFTEKLDAEGVEVRNDGRVVASATLDSRINIIALGVCDDVEYMNDTDGDIWQLIIYHGDSGDIYMDGSDNIIILSSDNNDAEPFDELLEWFDWIDTPFSDVLTDDDASVDPEDIEWDWNPDTVEVLSDATRLTEWNPDTL